MITNKLAEFYLDDAARRINAAMDGEDGGGLIVAKQRLEKAKGLLLKAVDQYLDDYWDDYKKAEESRNK